MSGPPSGFCPHCFHDLHGAWSCKRRTCPAYAPKYLRDQAERLRAALAEWDGETTIATLTAPGKDKLPWDTSKCQIQGPHEHSGPNGCVVDQWAAANYNRTITRRLSMLLAAATERTRRQGLSLPTLLAAVLELKRGVFHAHLIYGYHPHQRQALDRLLDAVGGLRGAYEFGTSKRGGFDRGQPGKYTGPHAGLYASKYLRPDGAKGSFIPALRMIEQLVTRHPETGRPTEQLRPVYVNPKLTRKSGVTMRFLRWARYAYVVWGRVDLPREQLLAVYRLVQDFGAELLPHEAPGRSPPPAAAIPF